MFYIDADLIGLTAAWICHVPGQFGSHHGRFHGLSKKMSLHTKVQFIQINNLRFRKGKNQALEEDPGSKIIVIPNGFL